MNELRPRLLEEAETRFQAVFDNALDPIMLVDDELHCVDVNPAACEMLGFTRDTLLQMTVHDLTPLEDRSRVPAMLEQFLTDGTMTAEYRLLCKDGSKRDIEFRAVANILPGVHLSIYRDITERKLAEERTKTSAVQLAEAQRIAHVGSWNWNIASGTIQWSDEHFRIFGLHPQEIEMTYDRLLTLVHPEDRATVENVVQKALTTGQPFDYRLRTVHRDGTIRLLQSRGRVAFDDNNRPVRMYGIVLDVTERQQTEDSLREYAERLQLLSHRAIEIQEQERRHLAHELHDEIGQVLSAISVNLQASLERPLEPSRVEDSLRLVDDAIQRVRSLSLDLRPSMLDDLGLISTLRWYADRQAQRAGFELHFHAEAIGDRLLPDLEITCYRVIQEALTNIVRHARATEVWLDFMAREEEVELFIRDNGVGFDLETVFAQASSGVSFGVLGMKERVELMDGRIDINAWPGRGTCIRVFIPIAIA